jgi:hypothetical protein
MGKNGPICPVGPIPCCPKKVSNFANILFILKLKRGRVV